MQKFCVVLLAGLMPALLLATTVATPVPIATAQQGDSATFPITIVDATGREVTIDSIERIVSGSGDITEIIVELGFRDNLVGVDISATHPPEVLDELPAFGFARRLTLEPIATLAPTVFFCVQTCMPDAVLDQLRDLEIAVVILPDGDDVNLETPVHKIEMAAAALGVPDRGRMLAERVAREIDWVRTATANVSTTPYVLLLYFRGSRLQLVYGENTPAEALIEGAGGIDAAGEIGIDGYIPLNTEILLTAYPDYVLLMQGGVESAGGLSVVADLQGMSQTPAGQDERYLVYDDQYLLAFSTRTGQMLLDLAADLHPDLTWERTIEYPYRYEDDTGTVHEINRPQAIYATEELLSTVRALGFHAMPLPDEVPDNALIIAADEMALSDATETLIITIPNPDDIEALARALNVPGRGAALMARLVAES